MLGAKDAAALLGVGVQALYRYRADGMPAHKVGKRWKFKPDEITAWYATSRPTRTRYGPRKLKSAAPVETTDDPEQAGDEDIHGLTAAQLQDRLAAAKLLEIRARTAKHEHELATKRGEVVPVDEVRSERLKRIAAVKAGLLGLKSKLPAILVGLTEHEIAEILDREVHELLERFAGKVAS